MKKRGSNDQVDYVNDCINCEEFNEKSNEIKSAEDNQMINQQNKPVNQQESNKMIDQKLNQIIIEDIVEHHVNQENAENQFQENFTSQKCENAVQLRNVVWL